MADSAASRPAASGPLSHSAPVEARWSPDTAHHAAAANGHANGHPPLMLPTDVTTASAPSFRLLPPIPAAILPGGRHSLAGIAARAAGIGTALGAAAVGATWLAYSGNALWRVLFYVSLLALFHFLEFWTTAAYNTPAASVDAFLLTSNGAAYNAAHAVALIETTVRHTLLAHRTVVAEPALHAASLVLGFVLVAVGQAVRSTAMAHAGTNFNHLVQSRHKSGHVLVTQGVYARLRHPAYFGYFWWALGSQLVLGNWLSFVIYSLVLWYFFSDRIQKEEQFLVKFFADEYLAYRKRTPVGIPFVS